MINLFQSCVLKKLKTQAAVIDSDCLIQLPVNNGLGFAAHVRTEFVEVAEGRARFVQFLNMCCSVPLDCEHCHFNLQFVAIPLSFHFSPPFETVCILP